MSQQFEAGSRKLFAVQCEISDNQSHVQSTTHPPALTGHIRLWGGGSSIGNYDVEWYIGPVWGAFRDMLKREGQVFNRRLCAMTAEEINDLFFRSLYQELPDDDTDRLVVELSEWMYKYDWTAKFGGPVFDGWFLRFLECEEHDRFIWTVNPTKASNDVLLPRGYYFDVAKAFIEWYESVLADFNIRRGL